MNRPEQPRGPTAILCALPEELGGLVQRERRRFVRQRLEILELDLGGPRAIACVGGVGKVRAARAAALLVAEGAARLLVVGVCGGLRRGVEPGMLVHCTTAAQTDLAVRSGRECAADAELRRAWRELAPGPEGWFLTADRPVFSPWRRLRLARAFAGPCVADMETAAAAAVARAARVPWAALRAVTDRAGPGGVAGFRREFPAQAPRAANTVPELLARLAYPVRAGEDEAPGPDPLLGDRDKR